MSKKKMPRAAMTLKDFHGGSIPSDLPLPSAPGMTVDRSGYERQSSAPWMSPTLGRGFGGDRGGYSRQGTANGIRTFEEKASYFPNPANIGRNYDEDERKPVDSRPRSSHSADRYDDHDRYEERRSSYEKTVDRYAPDEQVGFESRGLASSDRFPRSQQPRQVETDNYVQEEFGLIPVGPPRISQRDLPLTSNLTSEKLQVLPQDTLASAPSEQSLNKYSQQPSGLPYSSPFVASPPPRSWRTNAQQQQQPAPAAAVGSRPVSDSAPNVWTARREGEYSRGPHNEVPPSEGVGSAPWRNQRILEASAVEKVISGRWQSDRRPFAEQQKDGPIRPSSYGSGFTSDGGRPPFASEAPQFVHSAAEPVRSGYSSDQSRGPYSEAARANYSDPGRARYGDGRGRVFVNNNRGEHVDAEGRGYPDLGHGTFNEAGRERGDNRMGYQDFGRGSYPVDGVRPSYPAESGRRGYTEDRWSAGGGGYNDVERVVDPDRGAYVDSGRAYHEAGRIGFDSGRPMYADGSRGVYGDGVNNGELGRDGGYPDRVPYMDSGRGGYGVPGRGGYAERSNYPDSYGLENAESRQGYPVETARDNYLPNVGRGPHGPDSPRPGYPADRDRGGFIDNSRVGFSVERERNGSSFGPSRSSDIQASVGDNSRAPVSTMTVPAEPLQSGSAARADAPERPKLKLLPRSRPLEKSVESTVEVFVHEETVKDSRLLLTEKRLTESVESVVLESALTDQAGGIADNSDESNRTLERPKLNLKPRTRSGEPTTEDRAEKLRNSLFGGARPRELILKERGEDDAVITGIEPVVSGRAEILRVEKQEYWSDDKQEKRFEGRTVDRQGNNRLPDRQDSGRSERQEARKEPDRKEGVFRKDGRKDGDRQDIGRRELDRFENRRDQDRSEGGRREDKQERNRDIDKHDSWRRPADPAPASPGLASRNAPPVASTLVESVAAHSPGRFGHTAPASAVELAQAYSRSASLGSAIVGASRGGQRQVPSPLARSPAQGFGTSYLNGSPGPYGVSPKDAPFSRLAEAPGPAQNRDVFGPPGSNFGGERQTNGYGKPGSYGSGSNDPSRSGSFSRYEVGPEGRDWNDGGEEYPGKRGLPIRRNYE